jgi:uncharacterized SAM-binding protein YcdF (DUF218 family)
MNQDLDKVDAIFALGSPDLRVAERAAELYKLGYADCIICSGGFGKDTIYAKSEAETYSDVLIENGVPQDKIIIENKSTNTGENILFTKRFLESKNLNFKSFILVQKPYMERRTFATFCAQWSQALCLVTSPNISYEEYANDQNLKEDFINLMVGDLQRIKEYPKLGFQIEQEIPKEVWSAYEQLVKIGYNKYVI